MLRPTLRRGIMLGTSVLVSALAIVAGCSDDTAAPARSTSSSGGTSSGGTSGATSGGTSGTSGGPTGDAGGAGRKAVAQVNPYLLQNGTTHGSATFVENDGGVSIQLTVSQAEPGARGVHIHLGGSCDTDPGGHFDPNATTKNGEWNNIQVDDAGTGTLSDFRSGLTIEPATDGGTGIVGRTLIVHAAPTPQTIDAGTPPPKSGCGVIQAN